MTEEMLKTLNDLSKKETTELALQIMELTADNLSKDKEIENLNNIINELEKWLVEEQNLTCGCGITRDYLYAFDECLDKLQELKGSDRE